MKQSLYYKGDMWDRPMWDLALRNEGILPAEDHWDIYFPQKFTHIDRQLEKLSVQNEHQVIAAIAGEGRLSMRNLIWETLEGHYGREKAGEMMPPTYLLNHEEHLALLKKESRSDRLYILKMNLHNKLGLKICRSYQEIEEALIEPFVIAQPYIFPQFQIRERMMSLRLFYVVKCRNGKVTGHLHPVVNCHYTAEPFDRDKISSRGLSGAVTVFSPDVYQGRPENYRALQRYFIDHDLDYPGLIQDIEKLIIAVMGAVAPYLGTLEKLLKNPTFQLFGIDVALKETQEGLQPLLLEFNGSPSNGYTTELSAETRNMVCSDTIRLALDLPNPDGDWPDRGFRQIYP